MSRPRLAAALLLALAAPAASAVGADGPAIPTLAIGAPAPDFDLPGIDGRRYSLKDFAAAKLLVLVFTANHCPTAQAYEDRIVGLHNDYTPKGVQVVAISPNDPLAVRLDELAYTDLDDTLEGIRIRAKERGFKFPYLYDGETQATSLKYGPVATPHVYVFDKERKLQFSGRIDDKEDPSKATTHDTRDAIDALLAGKPVAVPTTKVFGCSVKWADKRSTVADGLKKWAAEPVTLETTDAAGIKELVKNPTKKLRLVNVWATWCGPCVTEFPDLVALHRTYRGRNVEVVTISADQPEAKAAALEFLTKEQASSRNVVFDKGDPYALIDLVDPEWRGALPHTILIAPGGKVIHRSEGAFDMLKVKKAIIGYIGRYYHSVAGE